jgi:hypothetical protein
VYCSKPDGEATEEEEVPAQDLYGHYLDGPPNLELHPVSYYVDEAADKPKQAEGTFKIYPL